MKTSQYALLALISLTLSLSGCSAKVEGVGGAPDQPVVVPAGSPSEGRSIPPSDTPASPISACPQFAGQYVSDGMEHTWTQPDCIQIAWSQRCILSDAQCNARGLPLKSNQAFLADGVYYLTFETNIQRSEYAKFNGDVLVSSIESSDARGANRRILTQRVFKSKTPCNRADDGTEYLVVEARDNGVDSCLYLAPIQAEY